MLPSTGPSWTCAPAATFNFSDYSLNKNRELGSITHYDAITAGLNTALTSDFAGASAY